MDRILVWFREDLRLNDHEPLFRAFEKTRLILPVYIHSPRMDTEIIPGIPKLGSFRKKFLKEGLEDLRSQLKRIGSNLIFREGHPKDEIAKLCLDYDLSEVYFNSLPGTEEEAEEKEVTNVLDQIRVSYKSFWGCTLVHPEDLPFPLSETPEVFTEFRKIMGTPLKIRSYFPKVRPLAGLPEGLDPGEFPPWETPTLDPRSAIPFRGGEDFSVQRMTEFLWVHKSISTYKETRNQMIGVSYSSKLSPFLSQGSLSPRFLYAQCQLFEEENGANESTYWFVFELLWRDYFHWILKKHSSLLFHKNGLRQKQIKPSSTNSSSSGNQSLFDKWKRGETKNEWVDAHMQELLLSGYMSNRGRQNVASYLVHELKLDWRWGASWFESQLVDYNVAVNWGNWAYLAGVGNDPRSRVLKMETQRQNYDPKSEFIHYWLDFR